MPEGPVEPFRFRPGEWPGQARRLEPGDELRGPQHGLEPRSHRFCASSADSRVTWFRRFQAGSKTPRPSPDDDTRTLSSTELAREDEQNPVSIAARRWPLSFESEPLLPDDLRSSDPCHLTEENQPNEPTKDEEAGNAGRPPVRLLPAVSRPE